MTAGTLVPTTAAHRSVRRPRAGTAGIVVGCVVVGVILLSGWFLPLPFSPTAIDPGAQFAAPGGAHLFGTDEVGGDVFSRTIAAARTDLPLALGGTLLALVIGVAGGLGASSRGPWGERVMRVLDVLQSLPLLVVTVALVALSGNSLFMVAVAIALISGPLFVRLVRSRALSLRESRFVEAATASGTSSMRIMIIHILPNLRTLVLAQTAMTAANALLVVAAMSFIGVGVQPPTPSWGAMIQTGAGGVTTGRWWLALFPALAIFLCVLSFNLIADGLRDRGAGRRARS